MRLALKTQARQQPFIELEIEELVLYGLAAGDRYRIAQALEQELAQLMTEQGIPQSLNQSQHLDVIKGGSFQIKTGTKPEEIGVELAQSLYRELIAVQVKSNHSAMPSPVPLPAPWIAALNQPI